MYSNVRTETWHGDHPPACPQYNEVVISINHHFSSGQVVWIICYGTPAAQMPPASVYNNESNLQSRVNELQCQLNYAYEDMKLVERENKLLNRFIDKAGLRDDWERGLKEEEVKKEMLKQMDETPWEVPPHEAAEVVSGMMSSGY